MQRGELYRVRKAGDSEADDPKKFRVFVVASRQALVDSKFSTVVCAPVFSIAQAVSTQVSVGPAEGLKRESWIMCDNLVSVQKSSLTQFVGSLSAAKMRQMDESLRIALEID